jgi:hypothetical protein
MQPAIVPSRETRNNALTSASPIVLCPDGCEPADECLLDLLRELVDDVVRADLHALARSGSRASAFGRTR